MTRAVASGYQAGRALLRTAAALLAVEAVAHVVYAPLRLSAWAATPADLRTPTPVPVVRDALLFGPMDVLLLVADAPLAPLRFYGFDPWALIAFYGLVAAGVVAYAAGVAAAVAALRYRGSTAE